MKVPFVMYADFECILTPISTCNPTPIASYTKKYQHHEATSYCLYTTRHDDQLEEPITYFGPDAAHQTQLRTNLLGLQTCIAKKTKFLCIPLLKRKSVQWKR